VFSLALDEARGGGFFIRFNGLGLEGFVSAGRESASGSDASTEHDAHDNEEDEGGNQSSDVNGPIRNA